MTFSIDPHFSAKTLVAWLNDQPKQHLRYFQPFPFTEEAIRPILSHAKEDLYLGMWENGATLLGFFMLRGWDAGWGIPSFGVLIDHKHLRQGWGRLAVVAALTIARHRRATHVRLKVHPENHAARTLYQSEGFIKSGVDERTGDWVYLRALVDGIDE